MLSALSPRAQVYTLGILLIVAGLSLMMYKHHSLGLPIMPGLYRTVWTIEAKIDFAAQGEAVEASLALPKKQSNIVVLDTIASAMGYGFAIEQDAGNERAVWTRREASGTQSLYYKMDVYKEGTYQPPPRDVLSTVVEKPDWSGERLAALRGAAATLIEDSHASSGDKRSFVSQLVLRLQNKNDPDSALILANLPDQSLVQVALALLGEADIPAHMLRGLYLEKDRSRISPTQLIEFFDGTQWLVLQPINGAIGLPDNFMIWQRGDKSLLDITGGTQSRVRFSILANDIPLRQVATTRMENSVAAIADFSIYTLPIEQQSVFKFILLIPVGALVVIVLRVLVGVRTAGTFMPVLLAIAFIQTTLLTGIVIFLLILIVGLWVRAYLSRLDLLLIARIAAVVVVVVAVMMLISVVSYKLGYDQALTVTFFPMIILAWTVEHMSILWEDDGPKEVMIQTAGSLAVATACYGVMMSRYVEHWTFNFPEVLLVCLGLMVILGHYTGYRLSELIRFRQFRLR